MSVVVDKEVRIKVLPDNDEFVVPSDNTLLEILQDRGLGISSVCNGEGTCGKCKVRFTSTPPPPTEPDHHLLTTEELREGWRLACQHRIKQSTTIFLPSADQLDVEAKLDKLPNQKKIDPRINVKTVKLTSPGGGDQLADVQRLYAKLPDHPHIPLSVLRKLPSALRENDFQATLVQTEDTILDILSGNKGNAVYGVAIDIGTTTLATYLFDLATGEQLANAADLNPQVELGADVITRIKYVHTNGQQGIDTLQNLVLEKLSELVGRMAKSASIDTSMVYEAIVVGNPTMIHAFLGIDPSAIDHSPYLPVITDALSATASEIGLPINDLARVYSLPSISAFFGADLVAGMLYANLGKNDLVELLIDIGTNGEIALATGNKIFACSTAAGPAFEGGAISQGMIASAGAISSITVKGNTLSCSTIADKSPIGICGSGLLDCVAELNRVGLIDKTGLLRKGSHPLSSRIEGEGTSARFKLSEQDPPVFVTQADIRELQLAKGAIRAGIDALLEHAGLKETELDRVLIGGAFGSSLRPGSLIGIGLLPPLEDESLVFLGNSAGQGAKVVLLDKGIDQELNDIVNRTNYIELSFLKSFSKGFVSRLQFPSKTQLEEPDRADSKEHR